MRAEVKDGTELGCRFSLPSSQLGYCGPPGAPEALYRAAVRHEAHGEAREALRGFEALMPYLEAIADRAGLDPFDRRVMEAYWIGNELLEGWTREDFSRILDTLVLRGLPRPVADELRDRLPPHPLPHHMFHVCFVGVGQVTGHVETTLENIESCRPSWGTVLAVEEDRAVLLRTSLVHSKGRFALGAPRPAYVRTDPELAPKIDVGSRWAIHWGLAVAPLTREEEGRLARYSSQALEQANASAPREPLRTPA